MLESLSSELIIHILHCCEHPTILRFAATSKKYSELVTQSTSLQLHIELEASGLELAKGSSKHDATYSAILDDLKGFYKSWIDLHVGQPIMRPAGKARALLRKLQEGLYIKGFSQSERRLADALQFISLDSSPAELPPLLFDFTFDEFAVDPGQGLIAIVSRNLGLFTTIHVDLCSIGTGLTHSLAQCPRLIAECDFKHKFFSPELAIKIIGEIVLTKVSNSRLHVYELLIWDWRTGNLLNRIASRQGICDFTFLDRHHLVILSGTRSYHSEEALQKLELLIYTLPYDVSTPSTSPQGQLMATDLDISQPILRLAFPQIQDSSKISSSGFYIGSDPTPGRSIYKNSADFLCSYATILTMTFGFSGVNTGWEGEYYRVFLDGRFLLDQVRICSNETMFVPWHSWGVRATRWFVTSGPSDHRISQMWGSRFVHQFSDQPYYCVLDFSPPNTRWLHCRTPQSWLAVVDGSDDTRDILLGNGIQGLKFLEQTLYRRSVDSGDELFVAKVGAECPSIISGPGFEERVTSQLPYQIICRTNNKSYHEVWQISGDHIVGIASRSPTLENLSVYKLERRVTPEPSD